MDRIDAIIIGAGVIGLAIARSLARAGRSVIILEKETTYGTGISSRNSEVIHAGIHYPRGSLKERLCFAGKHQLYDYCASRNVPFKRLGKLTFAGTSEELPRLETLAAHAQASRADDGLIWLDANKARKIEPALSCKAALLSPSSGIVDAHALMLSLLGEAEDNGAMLVRKTTAQRIERSAGTWVVEAGGSAIACDMIVNAAGLDAQFVAGAIEDLPESVIPPLHLAKGSYFAYSGRVPFSHLIYPLPITGGLGVHLTLDLTGQARFGPDVEWIEARDYNVSAARLADFAEAARRIWPEIDAERLTPAYAGIRPNLNGPSGPMADFHIQGPDVHALPGLVNLFGMDSPGLTSCLAIADHVTAILQEG